VVEYSHCTCNWHVPFLEADYMGRQIFQITGIFVSVRA